MKQLTKPVTSVLLAAFFFTSMISSCSKQADLENRSAPPDSSASRITSIVSPSCRPVTMVLNPRPIFYHGVFKYMPFLDSLYDIRYSATGNPLSARSFSHENIPYRVAFEYDGKNSLSRILGYPGNSKNSSWYYNFEFTNNRGNSRGSKITVTPYKREGFVYVKKDRHELYMNSSDRTYRLQQFTGSTSTNTYYVFHTNGNLALRRAGSPSGTIVASYPIYDETPSIYSSSRVWQILTNNFSPNNVEEIMTTWADMAVLRPLKVNYTYNNLPAQQRTFTAIHYFSTALGEVEESAPETALVWRNNCYVQQNPNQLNQ